MIGYYVHHHGRGHLHRALALAGELRRGPEPHQVVVLSSLPQPSPESPPWLQLPLDHDDAEAAGRGAGGPDYEDAVANGVLHWAPLRHDGLRSRMAAISAWIEEHRPRAMVVDVSQEVALLCRLHGVPVISVVQPGHRSDVTHRWGLGAATALCGFWPTQAHAMVSGLMDADRQRLVPLGALSRFAPEPPRTRRRRSGEPRRVVVMDGAGGAREAARLEGLDALRGDWDVTVLGAGRGARWVEDPWPLLREADVAVVHAGQNAVAEVAAARVPAVVIPSPRPFGEQLATASQLAQGPWPVLVQPWPASAPDWPELLDRASRLDGTAWASWCDGGAAHRFAELVRDLADEPGAHGVQGVQGDEVRRWA